MLNINKKENLDGIIEGLMYLIKSVVKETMKETIEENMTKMNYLNQTLTSEELCKRWGCCKNSLRNKEIKGIIAPLGVNGKKKVYSMRDILVAEGMGDFGMLGMVG